MLVISKLPPAIVKVELGLDVADQTNTMANSCPGVTLAAAVNVTVFQPTPVTTVPLVFAAHNVPVGLPLDTVSMRTSTVNGVAAALQRKLIFAMLSVWYALPTHASLSVVESNDTVVVAIVILCRPPASKANGWCSQPDATSAISSHRDSNARL